MGEDDDGYRIRIKFKYFMEYLVYNQDDSPLYLFESSFDNSKKTRNLQDDYKPLVYFKEDLFDLVI